MSEIALYEVLKQIPNVKPEQAKEAVAEVAKKEEVATKLDIAELRADINANIAKLDTDIKYLRWFMALGFSLTIAILKLL